MLYMYNKPVLLNVSLHMLSVIASNQLSNICFDKSSTFVSSYLLSFLANTSPDPCTSQDLEHDIFIYVM